MYHFKIMLIHKFLDLYMLPKLLMNGIKLESETPTQEQVAHQQDIDIPYKVKYRCKFCEMLWLDCINWLYFSRFWPFSPLFSLKTLPKMELKTSDNSYKPIKNHWLGNATRSVCRKWNMDVNFVKKMSLAYAGYIYKIFTLFPLFAYKLLPTRT